jgi:tetratricopeptide (TPR) repeat protein
MTNEIGLNSTIRTGKRKLHLQTAFLKDTGQILTSIFQDGQLIDKRSLVIDVDNSSIANLEKEVRQLHTMIISDLELLFYVAAKVAATGNIPFIERLGYLFFKKGFFDEAIEQFQNILKLDPKNTKAKLNIAKAFLKKEDFTAALEILHAALTDDPDNPEIFLLLGQTFQRLDDFNQSIKAIKTALVLDDTSHVAQYSMGLGLLNSIKADLKNVKDLTVNNTVNQASIHIRHALKLSSNYDVKIIEHALEKLNNREMISEAIAEFERVCPELGVLEPAPFNESEYYLKFMFTVSDKDNKELGHYIAALEKDVTLHANDADNRQSLGIAYLIRSWQYFAKAVEEFRTVVKVNSASQKSKQRLKLLENEGRGFLLLLRAIIK